MKKIDSKTKNKTIISSTSINDANKKENDNQKIKTTRNPGVDLLRIISMYSVVVHHYLVLEKMSIIFLNIEDSCHLFIVL